MFQAIPIVRVTQVAVFEEFNAFLLISDKSLIAYHLDVVCSPNGVNSQATQDSARRAPQKLSGGREVGFFAAGRMKDRLLLMYKKRDGLSSTFKVGFSGILVYWMDTNEEIRSSSQSFRNQRAKHIASSTPVAPRQNSSVNTTSSTSLLKATASTCSTHHWPSQHSAALRS